MSHKAHNKPYRRFQYSLESWCHQKRIPSITHPRQVRNRGTHLRKVPGLIPRWLSFDWSVVRFNPRRAAAPSGPPSWPLHSRRTRRTRSRSCSRRVPLLPRLPSSAAVCSSESGACKTDPGVRITERSKKFSSSRIFPGHAHCASASMVFAGILVMDLFIRLAYFRTKCSTRSRISSRRSRKGGMRMGNTFSR